jgi:ATP-dependent RNA helicase SUPV3L1/SUV3
MTSQHQHRNSRSGRGVMAVLGPTNTGKTHLAIERMVAHRSGLIGLPLRLLAREVYERVAAKVGAAHVELVTGEEKINAGNGARFTVATVEAMPEATSAEFVAIDEVQLAGDLERGHVFTDRILNLRGAAETLLLGAATVQRTLQELLPGLSVVTRPRMSMLTCAGQKKITRLPARSAIVAFSADEVYAIAELIRRQRGGAAVVLGSLSPRTRNAQVALYQSGDVDFLVATDAIGMGLNLDVDHVAFAQDRKFDGLSHRRLTAAEMGQIAGRAGRHTRNGTFGVTGQLAPFEDEIVERLETHAFDPLPVLVWRNRDLDFSGMAGLRDSLEQASADRLLMKSFPAADLVALDTLARDAEVRAAAEGEKNLRLFWDVCQVPDYRKISPGEHAELLRSVFLDLVRRGGIDTDWFARQVKLGDRADGDIDALSARIAHVRTWNYLANRAGWIEDGAHWREATRAIEDRLSDALHDALTKRFVDRRTSVLMKRLRENAMLDAEITAAGDVIVEGHKVGRLSGFRFTAEPAASGAEAKATSGAAAKALAAEIERRAAKLAAAPNGDFALGADGAMRWLGESVAKAVAAEDALKPRAILLADEHLTGAARDQVAGRLERWLANHVATLLKPLVELATDDALQGMARGVAFRLVENFGVLERRGAAADIQSLDQAMRAGLRRHGVRFGAFHVFIPALLKPAPVALICLLWGLKSGNGEAQGLAELPAMLAAGRTSIASDAAIAPEIYRLCGFRQLGPKAVRIDILERLADLIRPALAWKAGSATPPPNGAVDGKCFVVTPAMLSILGATHENMEAVLTGLGYRADRRPEAEVAARMPSRPLEAARNGGVSMPEEAPTDLPTPGAEAAVVDEAPSLPAATPEAIGETANTEAPGEAQPAEAPKLVALWRPGRRDREEGEKRRHQRFDHDRAQQRAARRGDGKAAEGIPAASAAANGGESGQAAQGEAPRPKPPRRFDKRERRGDGHGKGRPEGHTDGAAGDGQHAASAKRREDGRREDGRREDGRHEDRRNEGRHGKRDGRPGGERARQEAPQRRADPDSPFAVLAQLKARLEKPNG